MKKLFLFVVLTAFIASTNAKIKPGSLINDHMVLQQNSEVKLWGWAKPNTKVSATGSWNHKSVSCKSNAEGKWELRLATPKGGYTPYELTLSDGEKLTIKDVLIGEVWLGSGQSNMEMPLLGYWNCPIENYNKVLLESTNYKNKFRFTVVAHQIPIKPVDDVKAEWKTCSIEDISKCSAVCYFFGITLASMMDCPVGLIDSSWGGTGVETWTAPDVIKNYENVDVSEEYLTKHASEGGCPSTRYNGMIYPLNGYTLKGFIWYQGCANCGNAHQYAERLGNMIKDWRKFWGDDKLPFYEVEIAPYQYSDMNATSAAILREAQLKMTHEVENTGIVCTNDLVLDYEYNQIHPAKKREVGERLAMMALSKTYGVKGLKPESPEFEKMEIKEGKAYLSFSNIHHGFNRFADIVGFEICGANGKWYPAFAKVSGGKNIMVCSPEVNEPKNVRYCFKNWQIGNLANAEGMPVFPFRTDK